MGFCHILYFFLFHFVHCHWINNSNYRSISSLQNTWYSILVHVGLLIHEFKKNPQLFSTKQTLKIRKRLYLKGHKKTVMQNTTVFERSDCLLLYANGFGSTRIPNGHGNDVCSLAQSSFYIQRVFSI